MSSQIERFRVLMDVYTDSSGDPVVMSDLSSAVFSARSWPLLSVCAPGLYYASLMGKVGPWKENLANAWANCFSLSALESRSGSQWSKKSLQSNVCLRSLQLVEAFREHAETSSFMHSNGAALRTRVPLRPTMSGPHSAG